MTLSKDSKHFAHILLIYFYILLFFHCGSLGGKPWVPPSRHQPNPSPDLLSLVVVAASGTFQTQKWKQPWLP